MSLMKSNVAQDCRQIRPASNHADSVRTDGVEPKGPHDCCKNLRFMMWNPCSIANESRRIEISRAFKGVHVGALIGTRVRRPESSCKHTFQRGLNHNFIHFGWQAGVFTNCSAGVSLMLSKKVSSDCIQKITAGPDDLAGRAGSVRIQQGPLRVNIIMAYFPPRPSSGNPRKPGRWAGKNCSSG